MPDHSSFARFKSWLVTCIMEMLVVGLLLASLFFYIGAEKQRKAFRDAGHTEAASTP